jgi:hypothetical protein
MFFVICISGIAWFGLWLLNAPKPVLDFLGMFVLLVVAVWLVFVVAEWALIDGNRDEE